MSTCRDVFPLLSAERDRPLAAAERTTLDAHLAGCPACRATREALAHAATAWTEATATVDVPDANVAWQELRRQLQPGRRVRGPARPWPKLVAWTGAPLATAAALAVAFWTADPAAAPLPPPRADYVEAGDARASTVVYVDADSGWLIVWATPPGSSG